ncbi:MAG: hypothetical protein ACI86X_000501 [Moritella sp.]|jgi:hypothetical protein
MRLIIYVQSIRQHALIDELQLGQQLNRCALNGDRAKFALLLSMLSSDISDQKQSQFEPAPQRVFEHDASRMARLNQYAVSNNLAAMRLEICFSPESDITVGDVNYVAEPVLKNTSHLQQLKLAEQALIKPMPITGAGQDDAAAPSLLDVLNSYDASKPLQVREVIASTIGYSK